VLRGGSATVLVLLGVVGLTSAAPTAPAAAPPDAFKPVLIGTGYIENTARAVVRTADDAVYVFAADDTAQRFGTGPGVARAWKGNVAGFPTSFSEMDGADRPVSVGNGTNVIMNVDPRLDGNGTVHVLYLDEATGILYLRPFSTLTDTWGAAETVATNVNVPSGFIYQNVKRARNVASVALDADDGMHLVYVSGTEIYYRVRPAGGAWTAPVVVASTSNPTHPMLAFGPDGTLHLSWLDNVATAVVYYSYLPAGGTWQARETVQASGVQPNDTQDQGPSISVASSGRPYVLWISPKPADAVRIEYRDTATGAWTPDPLPADLFTHAPQVYTRGNDVYAFLGHDSQIRFGYQAHLAGSPWSAYVPLTETSLGTVDGSASIRWDPLHETNAGVIDTTFYDEDKNDTGQFHSLVYYMAVIPPNVTTPPDPTPPAVSLTAPAPGASVAGTVTVSASASDNVGVAGVRFQVDGLGVAPEATTAPYSASWDTTTSANGSHTVTAVARDAAGNSSTASVTVTVSNVAPPPSPAGLVAAYAFDEGTGTTVRDASGKANNGTASNATWSTGGKNGGALSFNGASSSVSVPDASSLDLTSGMTLEAWVKPTAGGSPWRTVVFKEQAGGMVYSLYGNQGTGVALAQVNVGGERNAAGTSVLPLNVWTHLASTYDGSTLRLYVNGTLVTSTAVGGAIPASTGVLRIGGNSVWPEWFAGLIDDVRVYRVALTATQLADDMSRGV
jgi:hypothetical protein